MRMKWSGATESLTGIAEFSCASKKISILLPDFATAHALDEYIMHAYNQGVKAARKDILNAIGTEES